MKTAVKETSQGITATMKAVGPPLDDDESVDSLPEFVLFSSKELPTYSLFVVTNSRTSDPFPNGNGESHTVKIIFKKNQRILL
jgi:hypothetical protein